MSVLFEGWRRQMKTAFAECCLAFAVTGPGEPLAFGVWFHPLTQPPRAANDNRMCA